MIRVFAAQDLVRAGAGEHPDRVRTSSFPRTDVNGRITDIDDFLRVEFKALPEGARPYGRFAPPVLTSSQNLEKVEYEEIEGAKGLSAKSVRRLAAEVKPKVPVKWESGVQLNWAKKLFASLSSAVLFHPLTMPPVLGAVTVRLRLVVCVPLVPVPVMVSG